MAVIEVRVVDETPQVELVTAPTQGRQALDALIAASEEMQAKFERQKVHSDWFIRAMVALVVFLLVVPDVLAAIF